MAAISTAAISMAAPGAPSGRVVFRARAKAGTVRGAGLAGAVVALLLAALPVPAGAVTLTDGRGRAVSVTDTGRIVAVGGTVTEILWDLGLGDSIVAVDSTSLYPPEALKTKADIGYMRQLSPEGVLAERPSVVIADGDAGPPAAIDVLSSSAVPLVMIEASKTPEAIPARVRLIAEAVGRQQQGEVLVKQIEADFARLDAARALVKTPARALFILSMRNGQPMVAGSGTAADGALKLAGLENVAAGIEGYKPMTEEAIVSAAPEVIVMMNHGPGGLTADEVFAMPAFRLVPAATDKRFVQVDGLELLGFGPRTATAALALCGAVDPACKVPAP